MPERRLTTDRADILSRPAIEGVFGKSGKPSIAGLTRKV